MEVKNLKEDGKMDVKELMLKMKEAETGNKSGGIRNLVLEGLKKKSMSLDEMKAAGYSRSTKSLSSYMSYLKKGDNMAHTYVISGSGENAATKRRLIGRKHKKTGDIEVWHNGAWVKTEEAK